MGVQYRQAKTVLVESNPATAYMLDGERKEPRSLHIKLNHKSLKVMFLINNN